jgi:Cu-processing system permease protein
LRSLTAGVVVLGLQGVAFMGGGLEQVSGFSHSERIVTIGEITSLLMPSESIWRRAAFEMQTPLAGSLSFSPFANVSIPSGIALAYATLFAVAMFAAAVRRLSVRDL